jgi:CRP-like cAMP-binding protein
LDIQTTTILVREGQHAESLWYLVSGEVLLERKGQETTRISKPGFVGEIAWLTKGPASATVIADEGVEVLHWDAEELRKAARRSTRLELSLESLIAQDLAKKLSKSRPINEHSALSAH